MKTLIITSFFSLLCLGGLAQESKTVFGTVSDGTNPMENVTVSILDREISTVTDGDGKYKIQAEVGDKLQFIYTGMRTVTIRVEDVTRVLNPIMIPDVTELDEVEVAASKRRSQSDLEEDYSINKNIIRTAWGYLDADRAAGQVRIMTEEEINPVNLCVLDLLRNEFAGVFVFGNCTTGGGVQVRGANSVMNNGFAVFDIDGQIFNEAPIWLDINNIKRLGVLGNFALTVAYGNLGRNGVIVINTIGGSPKNTEFVDRARLRNNYDDGSALTRSAVDRRRPRILSARGHPISSEPRRRRRLASARCCPASRRRRLDTDRRAGTPGRRRSARRCRRGSPASRRATIAAGTPRRRGPGSPGSPGRRTPRGSSR